MIVYSVECLVDKAVADKWERYFIEVHLDDVFRSGCFTGYSFRKDQADVDQRISFVSEYYCESMDKMEEYNEHHAPALKQDIMEKFEGQFAASRRFFEICTQRQ